MTIKLRVALLGLSVILSNLPALAQWAPSGNLRSVQVIPDCTRTGGDIAVARPGPPPVIFFCPQAAAATTSMHPGAEHFYYVHEFGHIAIPNGSEPDADCWAARQLASAPNGELYLRAAIGHFQSRGAEYHPAYGTALERAQRIQRCAGMAAENRTGAPAPTPLRETPAQCRTACDRTYATCSRAASDGTTECLEQAGLSTCSACGCPNYRYGDLACYQACKRCSDSAPICREQAVAAVQDCQAERRTCKEACPE